MHLQDAQIIRMTLNSLTESYIKHSLCENPKLYIITNGTKWGTIGANRKVACKTFLSGDNHPEWKAINYVQNSNGTWDRVDKNGEKYGFVNTGLASGSGYKAIPFYGKW